MLTVKYKLFVIYYTLKMLRNNVKINFFKLFDTKHVYNPSYFYLKINKYTDLYSQNELYRSIYEIKILENKIGIYDNIHNDDVDNKLKEISNFDNIKRLYRELFKLKDKHFNVKLDLISLEEELRDEYHYDKSEIKKIIDNHNNYLNTELKNSIDDINEKISERSLLVSKLLSCVSDKILELKKV